jgi:hypothetical protein
MSKGEEEKTGRDYQSGKISALCQPFEKPIS